MIVNMNMMW